MASVSKKRKRDTELADEVTLQVSAGEEDTAGPVLASFPVLKPSESTPFRLYHTNSAATPSSSKDTILVGETDTVEFVTSPESEDAPAGCSYLVAVYNKKTKTAALRPAPVHLLKRHVKALKNLKPMEVSVDERNKLRNQLGETFGTKKAKAAIRAQERNKVDLDAVKGVAHHILDRIEENTTTLPSQEQAKATTDSNRLIPPYDADASRVDDVYKLHDIIPEAEFNAISIGALTSSNALAEKISTLPYGRSKWVNQHLNLICSAPKTSKRNLKILWYISLLMGFKGASRQLSDKTALSERLKNVPPIVLDGLFSRFTESARDKTEAKITPQKETLLLTHMFALCLRLDDYATDTTLLASDMSMSIATINPLFKSMGCKIESLGLADLKRLGLPDSAAETKRAILKVPLVFPKDRVKRARR